jgi:hypothetical protein
MNADPSPSVHFTPKGRTFHELVSDANCDAPDIETANLYLAADMGLIIMQPGHPARADVIDYLTRFGQGCMFGLLPLEASPTIH